MLEELDELFTQRNRLVHAEPEPSDFTRPAEARPEAHTDLRNVARWLASTGEAVSRLGRSYAKYSEFERVAGPLVELDALLRSFLPDRDGDQLQRTVRKLLANLPWLTKCTSLARRNSKSW